MKSLILALSVLFASTSFAATAYKSAGCGLGSLIIKDEGFVQIFAATTNGTFGSQTFGITSGTSNCAGAGGYASQDAQEHMYVETNRAAITQEMAQGSGEHLNALANMLGCEKASNATFATAMKKNYKTVASKKDADQMLNSVKTVISSDAALAQSCKS